jgi:hypothetical protein
MCGKIWICSENFLHVRKILRPPPLSVPSLGQMFIDCLDSLAWEDSILKMAVFTHARKDNS